MSVLRFTHFFQHVLDTPPCGTITLSPSSISNIEIGVAYSQTITASGGVAPYTYAVSSGSLPTGLSLNTNTGLISGTPTTQQSVSFTIEATDDDGCTGSQAYSFSVDYDTDAQAFITAAGITDNTQKSAINTLVNDMKGYGIWTKMKAIYPFVGGTATTHKFNLKDPRDLDAAFRLVFNGGWTHSSTGADPNGTNAYADTFLNFNTTMLLNDAALSFYSREDIFTAVLMGCGWDFITSMISPNFSSGVGEYSTINGGGNGTGVANKSGLFTISRLTSTNVIGYRNGSQYFNRAVTSTSKPNFKVYIGARNNNGATQYSSNQCAFSAIHDGLTATEAANLYTAVQAFQTTLSRNV